MSRYVILGSRYLRSRALYTDNLLLYYIRLTVFFHQARQNYRSKIIFRRRPSIGACAFYRLIHQACSPLEFLNK